MPASIELHTARLLLREVEEDDWQVFQRLNADRDVQRYLPDNPAGEEEARDMVRWCMAQAQTEPRASYDLAVAQRGRRGAVIGWCRIAWLRDEAGQAEIAYVLQRASWGQGLATETAQRLLQFGFKELGAHRITATCRPENVAGWRVLEKVGMQREGLLRQDRWMKKAWHDSYLYAMLDKEYRARK